MDQDTDNFHRLLYEYGYNPEEEMGPFIDPTLWGRREDRRTRYMHGWEHVAKR